MEQRTFCIACGSFCSIPNEQSTATTTWLSKTIPMPEELKLIKPNVSYNKVMTQIINSIGNFKLTTTELNVLCEQCTVLIQEYRRFYVEIKMIEQILKQQITENYTNLKSKKKNDIFQVTTDSLFKPEDAPKNLYSRDSNGLYRCPDCSDFATLKETTFIAHIKCHQLRGQSFPFEGDKIEIVYDNTNDIFSELITAEYSKSKPNTYIHYVKSNMTKDNYCPEENTDLFKVIRVLQPKVKDMPTEPVKGYFKCEYCPLKFLCEDFLREHFNTVHKRFELGSEQCDKCGDFLTDPNRICKHPNGIEDPMNCDDCERIFYKQKLLNNHYLRMHMKCFKCKKQFSNDKSLKVHYRACVLETYKCPACGLLCSNQISLNSHFSIHTGQQQYQCDLCPKKFAHELAMKRHQNTNHFKKVKYTCDVCGDLFVDYDRHRVHRLRHDHPFPFKCKYENCTERFKSTTMRSNHVRTDHLKRYYQCEFCGNKFKRVTQLKLHRQTHTKIGLFVCKYCPFRATRRPTLKNHYAKKHPNEEVGSINIEKEIK